MWPKVKRVYLYQPFWLPEYVHSYVTFIVVECLQQKLHPFHYIMMSQIYHLRCRSCKRSFPSTVMCQKMPTLETLSVDVK